MQNFESLPGTIKNNDNPLPKKNIRRVLGIDPGLANTGFGVVDFCDGKYRMVSYGCITTKSDRPHGERLLSIYNRLCAVIDEFKPNQIKQAVTGTTKADKELVERYVKILLGLKTEPKPDHAADALAGAITHLHFNSLS